MTPISSHALPAATAIALSALVPAQQFGAATTQTFVIGQNPGVLAAGDIDGDGDEDLVLADLVLQNDGFGNYTDVTATVLPTVANRNFFAAVLADLDLDGDIDLLVSQTETNPTIQGRHLALFENNQGVFTNITLQAFFDGGSPTVLVGNYGLLGVGDPDNNGFPDIYAIENNINGRDLPPELLMNDGTLFAFHRNVGRFAQSGPPLTSQPTFYSGTANHIATAIAVGDVDGDGFEELVVARTGAGTTAANLIFVNRMPVLPAGSVPFFRPQALVDPFGMVIDPTTDIELVDLDNDGDLDLVVANDDSIVGSYVAENDGSAQIFDPLGAIVPNLGNGFVRPRVVVADFDGNGASDLVFVETDPNMPGAVQVGMNGVGAPAGTFAAGVTAPTAAGSSLREVLAADVDLDGDPDLVVGATDAQTRNQVHLQPNRHRHTELVVQPVLGDTTLRIRAVSVPGANPGGQAAMLAIALATQTPPAPLPPFVGVLGLDPAQAEFIGVAAIPAPAGAVEFTLAVNYTPALIGVTAFFESAIAEASGIGFLTNTLAVSY